jgi:Insertion element 4 transposase N-terminal/Transposase DDE domain
VPEVPLSDDCAISVVVRAIRCAAGVFAPGHLGELTQYLPFELVDCVLEETRRTERRLRCLPSRVGVYFALAMCLFPGLGYLGVWGKLTAGLGGAAVPCPSEKALRDLRRRVGAEPLRALFETVAGPLAWPSAPGAGYRGYRTVAFDGCSSLKAPDLERNRAWLGRVRSRTAWHAYPAVMLMALVETGTRALIGAWSGPHDTGEQDCASRLLHLLGPGMLVLADRGFDGSAFLSALAATKAQFLVRLRADRRLPVLARLEDGSFLTRIGDLAVRVVDADITVTCKDGTVIRGRYRLATTLLGPRPDPAWRLVQLYHERWEAESAFYALRHTLMNGRVLRSGDPAGLEQELWALLLLYQLLRTAMADAAASRGADPDRASFTVAMETARDQLVLAAGIVPGDGDGLAGEIGRAVLARLLPARRHRVSARKVKSPASRYAARPADDDRPLASQDITSVDIAVHEAPPPPPPGTRAARRPAGRLDRLLDLLAADPARQWQPRDIAAALGIDGDGRILRGQLSHWSRRGLIRRDGWGTYTAPAPPGPPGPDGPPGIPPPPPTRHGRLLALLNADPARDWPRRHLAEALHVPPDKLKSFYAQLTALASHGTVHRTAPGRYSLTGTCPRQAT